MENHKTSLLAPTPEQLASITKDCDCRTDLLSSPEMMRVRGYGDASCIPPVPSVVKKSTHLSMESKIPKPLFSSKVPAKECWRLEDDCGITSPKGMDPCRFASIKGKFEAMQKHANEASPSQTGSIFQSHSLPAERVQRIAESLARLEMVFPEANTSDLSTSSIPRKDKVVNPSMKRPKATTKKSKSLMQRTGSRRANEAGKSKFGKGAGLVAVQSMRSTNMHASVSSLNQSESTSGPSLDQYKSSLESQTSSVESIHFSSPVDLVEPSLTVKACDGDQPSRRPTVVDTAFASVRDKKQQADHVATSEGRPASLNDSAENESWQNGSTLLTDDSSTIRLVHKPDTLGRDSQSTPSEQVLSSATYSREPPPFPRTFSAGCAPETRFARKSSSKFGHSYIGSFDSVWSMELSEPLSMRLPAIDAECEQCSVNSTKDVASSVDQDIMRAVCNNIDIDLSAPFDIKSALEQTADRNVRTPIGDADGILLETADVSEVQADELARIRILQWNSAPELDIPQIYGSNPTLDTLEEDRSNQPMLSILTPQIASSSTREALLTTSEASPRNGGRTTVPNRLESLDSAAAVSPPRVTAIPRTIVAPLHLGEAHRFCQSLGSMGDIRLACSNHGLTQQHSSGNSSRAVHHHRSDKKARSFAMCDFIFVSPEASGLNPARVDDVPCAVNDLTSLKMEDSASTVICGTPGTSRTPRLTHKQKLYSRLVSMMKSVMPGKRKSRKGFAVKKTVTFDTQAAPITPVWGGCLPRRFTTNAKGDSHTLSKRHEGVRKGSSGKKTWWKPSQQNEEGVDINDVTSHSPNTVRNSESSVHKYSRRHMFLMDKIENERLGRSYRPTRGRGQRDTSSPWLNNLQTS